MDTSEGAPATSTATEIPQRNFEPLYFLQWYLGVRLLDPDLYRPVFSPQWFAAMDTSEGKQPSSASASLSSISRWAKGFLGSQVNLNESTALWGYKHIDVAWAGDILLLWSNWRGNLLILSFWHMTNFEGQFMIWFTQHFVFMHEGHDYFQVCISITCGTAKTCARVT